LLLDVWWNVTMKTFRFALLALVGAAFVAPWTLCAVISDGKSLTGARDQTPIDSGAFVVKRPMVDEMLGKIQALCSSYGLEQLRNANTERQIGERDHRPVYDVTFHKQALIGVWLTNVISSDSFTFQLYAEPFSKIEYPAFRQAFIEIVANYKRDDEEISYSMKDGLVVKPTPKKGKIEGF
jgi:hypothetical protein